MLLSYYELKELVDQGVITADPDLINGTSIDVRLHDTIMVEAETQLQHAVQGYPVVDLSKKQSPSFITMNIDHGYIVLPGQCLLASTQEIFNLPNDISCEFKLKSSIARTFLNCMLATWCDPTWSNSRLTLELHNCLQHNAVLVKTGMKIGQMIFYYSKPVPSENSYSVKGRYNNTTEVTASKGV